MQHVQEFCGGCPARGSLANEHFQTSHDSPRLFTTVNSIATSKPDFLTGCMLLLQPSGLTLHTFCQLCQRAGSRLGRTCKAGKNGLALAVLSGRPRSGPRSRAAGSHAQVRQRSFLQRRASSACRTLSNYRSLEDHAPEQTAQDPVIKEYA